MALATRTKQVEITQRFLIHDIAWEDYEALCRMFADRGPRMTYDGRKVELMSPLSIHERYRMIVHSMIEAITEELDIPRISGGSTTFRREDLSRGLEPDQCYYFESAEKLTDPLRIDLSVDPAPDLAIEIEISRSALDRMSIYAALGVPEVWRFDGDRLMIQVLQPDRTFSESESSAAFPFLPMKEIERFLVEYETRNDARWAKNFRAWIRAANLPRDRES